jgi:hypothetical protein
MLSPNGWKRRNLIAEGSFNVQRTHPACWARRCLLQGSSSSVFSRKSLDTLRVGAMAEAVKLYQELGFPALQKGGKDRKLVGYRFEPIPDTSRSEGNQWVEEVGVVATATAASSVIGSSQVRGAWATSPPSAS